MSPADASVLRVNVVGAPGAGKSSLINRIVSHRFDAPDEDVEGDLPTSRADETGTFVKMLITSEPPVLLELQDQLKGPATALLNEPFWYEIEEEPPQVPPAHKQGRMASPRRTPTTKTALARGGTMKDNRFRTEEWTKTVDARQARHLARQQSTLNVEEPSPFPKTDWCGSLRRLGQEKEGDEDVVDDVDLQTNPLEETHGMHGYFIVFDLCSRESFAQAASMAHQLMRRVGYERTGKRPCPFMVTLVGNKADKTGARGKRKAGRPDQMVPPDKLVEMLAAYMQPGALVPRLKGQGLHTAFLRLIDATLSECKIIEQALMAGEAGAVTSAQIPEAEAWRATGGASNLKQGTAAADKCADGAPAGETRGVPPIDHEAEGMLSPEIMSALVQARSEMHPLAMPTLGMGRTLAGEVKLLTGLLAALEHAPKRALAEAQADLPASELAEIKGDPGNPSQAVREFLTEATLVCPALGVKYVEVSCKTNHQIHLLERVALRSMRLLPMPDQGTGGTLNPISRLGSSLSSLFNGGSAAGGG